MSRKLVQTYTPGQGLQYPFSGSLQTSSAQLFTSTPFQIGGVTVQNIQLTYTAFTANSQLTKTFGVALGFPSTTIPKGASGSVLVSAFVSSPVASGLIVGLPQFTFSSSTAAATVGNPGTFTLQPGRAYANMNLQGSLTVTSLIAQPQTVIQITVWAMLVGQPSS